jgi:hypothetical protein
VSGTFCYLCLRPLIDSQWLAELPQQAILAFGKDLGKKSLFSSPSQAIWHPANAPCDVVDCDLVDKNPPPPLTAVNGDWCGLTQMRTKDTNCSALQCADVEGTAYVNLNTAPGGTYLLTSEAKNSFHPFV